MTDHVALYHAFGDDRHARRAATASRRAAAPRYKKPVGGDAAESVTQSVANRRKHPAIRRSGRFAPSAAGPALGGAPATGHKGDKTVNGAQAASSAAPSSSRAAARSGGATPAAIL